MHIDLLHALVAGLLVFSVLEVLYRFDIVQRGHKRFDWRAFVAVFVVIFVLNLVWPL